MSNNDNLSVNNFGKICRTCLAEGKMKFLYKKCQEDVCLIEKLMSISFVQFSEEDGLPFQICLNCETELTRAYRFAQKCLEVDSKLRKCFKEYKSKINTKILSSKTSTEKQISETEDVFQIKTEIDVDEHTNDINHDILLIKHEILEQENVETLPESKDSKFETFETTNNDTDSEKEDSDENMSENESEDDSNSDLPQNENDSDFLPENESDFSPEDDSTDTDEDNSNLKPKKSTKKPIPKIPRIQGPPYKCKCSEIFGTYTLFSQHWIKVKHLPERKICKICSKSVTSAHIGKHMKIHGGEKPFCCEFCGITFLTSRQLVHHRMTHTGERPHKCNMCDKRFAMLQQLKYHMLFHSGERPHACDKCDKKFRVKRHLVRHLKTHTGERPHKCKICERAFAQASSLRIHLRTHTGDRPAVCDHCGKRFTSNGLLNWHLKSHNKQKEETT